MLRNIIPTSENYVNSLIRLPILVSNNPINEVYAIFEYDSHYGRVDCAVKLPSGTYTPKIPHIDKYLIWFTLIIDDFLVLENVDYCLGIVTWQI